MCFVSESQIGMMQRENEIDEEEDDNAQAGNVENNPQGFQTFQREEFRTQQKEYGRENDKRQVLFQDGAGFRVGGIKHADEREQVKAHQRRETPGKTSPSDVSDYGRGSPRKSVSQRQDADTGNEIGGKEPVVRRA